MGLTQEAIQRIRDAVGDDDEVIADILQSFVDEVDVQLGLLETAAATQDAKTLHRIAHTLKSSCRDLGDASTGDLCAKLEVDARAGDISNAGEASRLIAERILALKSEVSSYLALK